MSLDGAVQESDRSRSEDSPGYPLRYGYILTGRVSFCGSQVDRDQWLGRRVYAFHPHATHAVLPVNSLLPIPEEVPDDIAPLYANAETALSLHWDAGILPGEAAVIVGAGIVGMLVSAIARRSGAGAVVLVDSDERRRQWAERYLSNATDDTESLSGRSVEVVSSLHEAEQRLRRYPGRYLGTYEGFDVGVELTGNAEALDGTIDVMAFGGRLVVGSWYGDTSAQLHLGGRFHRGRVRLISSQVSTIPLPVANRIDYERRSRIVWDMLPRLLPRGIARRDISLDELDRLFGEIAHGTRVEPWVAVRY
jgi:threonine dehydrogenase-like Zn-dependent dehydrogenase